LAREETGVAAFLEAGFFDFARFAGCEVFFPRVRDGVRGSDAMGCSFLDRSVYARTADFFEKAKGISNRLIIGRNYESGEMCIDLDQREADSGTFRCASCAPLS
jgi:hypothetical protein